MASLAEKHFQQLAELSDHEYNLTLAEVLQDTDHPRRERRLWRLTGVILKKRFATAVSRRPTPATGARYRWDIDRTLLSKRIAERAWEIEILSDLPGRRTRKGETVADFAIRLKSETNFGKAFRTKLCQWVCSDPARMRALERKITLAGFGRLAKWLHPERLIGVAAAGLLAQLGLPHEQFGLAFAATFGIASTGVDALCEVAGYGPANTAAPNQSSSKKKRSGQAGGRDTEKVPATKKRVIKKQRTGVSRTKATAKKAVAKEPSRSKALR